MKPISRRTLLQGVGTAMALPYLEAMIPLTALAQSPKKRTPRMAFIFIPNGVHLPAWTPATEGAFELPATLEPLKNVKDSVMVLTGLAQHNGFALGDGPGDHARSAASWLTGCHPKKTAGADIKVGISVDQLAAQKVGSRTPFPSLEMGCERGMMAGNCDSGYSCAYSNAISWRSPSTPVAKEIDPRLVFERLFGNGEKSESAESLQKRLQYRKSILDLVNEDARALNAQLGTRDRAKLDEYFTCVREIEERLNRIERAGMIQQVPGAGKPSGIPSDFGEHIRLMFDMMALAFQADLTRVCTMMIANDGSNRPYRMINISEGHHDLSHHGHNAEKQAKIAQINRFHVAQLAYLLEKLQSIREPEGTILDNSMIVYGAGLGDGDRHNHDDLPILFAGKGGNTIKSARHIKYPHNTPMTNLFLSMLDRVGVPAESIGDSTGRLQQLF